MSAVARWADPGTGLEIENDHAQQRAWLKPMLSQFDQPMAQTSHSALEQIGRWKQFEGRTSGEGLGGIQYRVANGVVVLVLNSGSRTFESSMKVAIGHPEGEAAKTTKALRLLRQWLEAGEEERKDQNRKLDILIRELNDERGPDRKAFQ